MKYIVQGHNYMLDTWENLYYDSYFGKEQICWPLKHMAEAAARAYEEAWGGSYRVVEIETLSE